MFDHYLITRFNLRNPKWDVTKNNELLLTNDWMEDRMWLFENFCFPSVIVQSNKNFKWFLYFDTSTANVFREKIKNLTKDYSFIHVFFIDGMPNFHQDIKDKIKSESKNTSYIITSRIDNDDCIHVDFISEIQKNFKQQNYQAIDIVSGYTLQVTPHFRLGKKEHIFNPFISLIEKNENPETVWSNDHNMWKKESRITQITNKRLWMSVIHEKNKVNKFDGYGVVKWSDVNTVFFVSQELNRKITEKIKSNNTLSFSNFKNKYWINYFGFYYKIFKRKLGSYK